MNLPTPDYQSDDGSVTLYRGDWRELGITGGFDAIHCDPPYGISHPCNFKARGRGGLASCNDYPDVYDDDKAFDPSPLLAFDVPTVLWGGNHFADTLPASGGWLVWDKLRPDDLDQATCELAWTNCVKGVRRFSHLWNGCMRASERGENYHGTQKPVSLAAWVHSLRWCSGWRSVFDPYMGSSPIGVACVAAGMKYIGCEIQPEYFDIAVRRIEKAIETHNGGPMFAKVEHQPKLIGGAA